MTTKQAVELYRRLNRELPHDLADGGSHKYSAVKKEVDGILFASSGEARAYQLIKLWERAGAISQLRLQPRYTLHDRYETPGGIKYRAIVYIPDFEFRKAGRLVVVDFKGVETEAFKIKRKMFEKRYPDILFECWTRQTLKDNGI